MQLIYAWTSVSLSSLKPLPVVYNSSVSVCLSERTQCDFYNFLKIRQCTRVVIVVLSGVCGTATDRLLSTMYMVCVNFVPRWRHTYPRLCHSVYGTGSFFAIILQISYKCWQRSRCCLLHLLHIHTFNREETKTTERVAMIRALIQKVITTQNPLQNVLANVLRWIYWRFTSHWPIHWPLSFVFWN